MKHDAKCLPTDAAEVSAMRLPDAAKRIGCSRRFLELQIKAGHLRAIRLSARCVRIRPQDLADYLEGRVI